MPSEGGAAFALTKPCVSASRCLPDGFSRKMALLSFLSDGIVFDAV
ncbi:TPA: hypothetical protein ACFOL8_000607 [Neisseria meningitidis]|jgi:hypothetical protein|uniref:Uncharacterized protein n=2 Tax=Neisseria meningitidis TaxID=487 RepID=A0A121PVH2_NEIME|nr:MULTISPECIES: hypothetical protein [Neisseria]EOC15029.1 hypothetical protein NM73696_0265 [Neisseria meningitidis 73696]EQD08821.1 hypothetical protein NM151_0287 [Neisseria meningitidis NM151]EQD15578.1 hypothetical protein NM0552_0229 [Neisseria meningitidis NM0552]KER40735.1 hypothetical protein F528_0271 [Neisseria meningitidis 992008]MCI3999498.1 hypothetical protein [Klebsiella pneumoniae]CCA43823.1 hypothetical protein NMALPHA522_0282 [Neisseria meningitidis alpha522]